MTIPHIRKHLPRTIVWALVASVMIGLTAGLGTASPASADHRQWTASPHANWSQQSWPDRKRSHFDNTWKHRKRSHEASAWRHHWKRHHFSNGFSGCFGNCGFHSTLRSGNSTVIFSSPGFAIVRPGFTSFDRPTFIVRQPSFVVRRQPSLIVRQHGFGVGPGVVPRVAVVRPSFGHRPAFKPEPAKRHLPLHERFRSDPSVHIIRPFGMN